jgi:hypothetical protein
VRFVGARIRDADAGLADRNLLRARTVANPLESRLGRRERSGAKCDLFLKWPAIQLHENLTSFDMGAVVDRDRLHDPTSGDAENQRPRLLGRQSRRGRRRRRESVCPLRRDEKCKNN